MPLRIPRLLERLDQRARQRAVDEELRLHIEMQAADYERTGFTPEEALSKAERRFGDLTRIRNECIELSQQSSVGMWLLKILFAVAFVSGIFIRNLGYERPVTRVGDVLIMIAIFGGLLVMGKKKRPRQFGVAAESLRLDLQTEILPPAFDEKGRTPFERVSSDS